MTHDLDHGRSAFGAYGFEITGLERPAAVLRPAGHGWPRLSIVRRRADPDRTRPPDREPGELRFDDHHADLWLSDTELLRLERAGLQLQIATAEEVSDDAVAHPFLGLPAAVAAQWHGRQILHGGGFVLDDRVWAVLGTKEAGKSSTMAWALGAGLPVVTDDLLMIEAGSVFAGPASIDLRHEATARFGGEMVTLNAGRRRWRLRLGPVAPCTPLAGLVELAWGDDVAVDVIPPAERLPVLIANSVLGLNVVDASAYLDLAALPMMRFTRPQRIDDLDRAGGHLLESLA